VRLGAPAALLFCAGCNPQSLQGSLTAVLTLDYTHATLSVAADQAALTFLRPVPIGDVIDAGAAANSEDTVFKVVTYLTGATLAAAKGCKVDTNCTTPEVCYLGTCAFDLSQILPGTMNQQRGQLSRFVLNDPVQTFPPIQRGDFYVTGNPVLGKNVGGYFTVTFTEGIDEASGRTVYGGFTAKVVP
jgi:hypothetical protein